MKNSIGKIPVSKGIELMKLAQNYSGQPINTPKGIKINRKIVEQSINMN